MSTSPPERVELPPLVLRRERVTDEGLVAAAVGANLEHLRPWMPWATPEAATASAQRERLRVAEEWWDAGSDFSYLLLDTGETELLGIFGLHRRIGPHAIELGYWLARPAVGYGYASAAAEALTLAALDVEGIDRVEIHCDEANLRSRRIPERLAYTLDRVENDEVKAPAELGRSMIWVRTR